MINKVFIFTKPTVYGFTKVVNSQEELDDYLQTNEINVGDILIRKTSYSWFKTNNPQNTQPFIMVVDIIQDYTKLPVNTDRGYPKCMKFCYTSGGSFVMDDSFEDFMKLPEEDFKQYVEPQYDLIKSSVQGTIEKHNQGRVNERVNFNPCA